MKLDNQKKYTIGSSGCLLTCFANAKKVSPDAMNQLVEESGGYSGKEGASINTMTAPPLFGFEIQTSLYYEPCNTGQVVEIGEFLCDPNIAVVAWVAGSGPSGHYILVKSVETGKSKKICPGVFCRLRVNDPAGKSSVHTYLDEYSPAPDQPGIVVIVYCQGGCLKDEEAP